MSSTFEVMSTAKIDWRNGVPYSLIYDDLYYSKNNGLSESKHVFIESSHFVERWKTLDEKLSQTFVIAETGFGTGLNFLLSYALWKSHAPPQARLHYIACEKHPLSLRDLDSCLAQWPDLKGEANDLLSNYPVLTPGFHCLQFEKGRVTLTLMLGDVLNCFEELLICGDPLLEQQLRESYVDAWFLDGFSPVKNPEMWQQSLFTTMGLLSKPRATVATYTAAGVVKEGLQKAGFKVNKVRGHGLKKDMVTAEFCQLTSHHTKRQTPWSFANPKKNISKEALIIGSGLAGCFIAYSLALRGWSVKLLESGHQLASGASGIPQALLYPKITRYRSPLNTLMLSTFLFAHRTYKHFLAEWPVGELLGMIQLAYNQKEERSQEELSEWLTSYPDLGRLVSPDEATKLAGLDLVSSGLYVPLSGWINCPLLCQYLIASPRIQWIPNTVIDELTYKDEAWYANDYVADVLVIANGDGATSFEQTQHIPLKKIRGQMTWMNSKVDSQSMRIPVCAEIHLLPDQQGTHLLGATYHSNRDDRVCDDRDDESNLSKLSSISSKVDWTQEVSGHWCGIRAATPDYLPLVGPVAKAEAFKETYHGFQSNSKRWIPTVTDYHAGLYLCAGFGSRGLTTIPLCAEWLATIINKEQSMLPRTMIQSFSPARFLRREIIRGQR